MGLLLACLQTVRGFVLPGPDNEAYQTPEIGYMLGGDNGAPKNVAEEYRRVIPTLYWSVDQSFLDYFGTTGLSSIEGAFRILNALTNVSSYSLDLTEFPLESRNINFRAQALGLIDMRSCLLAEILENMGLGEADRYVWCLRSRTVGTGGCPDDVTYVVQKRNWEFVPTDLGALKPSSYVNGNLFSYMIEESCNPPNPLADAYEFPVDPSFNRNSAAASLISYDAGFDDLIGTFLTGLTRDDMAGLRYLYRAGNINWEPAGTGVEQFVTNYDQYPYLIYTSNLTQFAEASKTNDAATLMGLYQGLQVMTTSNYLVKVINTNTYSYVTNEPWGTGLITVYGTNYTTNIAVRYTHTFGDSFRAWTNSTWSTLGFLETRYESDPWMPAGTTPTNKTYYSTMLAHVPSGAFYIMSNFCDVEIVSTQLVTTMAFTNLVYASTNAAGGSNTVPTGGSLVLSQSVVYVYKDYILAARPVTCVTNTVGLRRGMERMTFVRRDYDSMLGRYWEPVTNQYSRMGITNSTEALQRFRRVVSAPDFLIQADSETVYPSAISRTITFDESTKMPNLAGPGTIDTPVTITFNKAGPTWLNYSGDMTMDEASAIFRWNWGYFDGSTNAPLVYPEDAGIDALERQMLMQVTTGALPSGKKGKTYPVVHMTGTGGLTPYSWGLADGSPGLPPGLSLSTDGTLSGIPALAGTFDFMVQMTDAGGVSVLRAFAVKINP